MIIGLTGKLESGKDTIADYLVKEYDFKKVGFADELYAGVCALFGIPMEDAFEYKNEDMGYTVQIHQGFQCVGSYTWREFLQRFGSEMARDTWDKDFWVERFEAKYLDNYTTENLVVKDVRFNNEAGLLGYYGGTVWEIHRPGYEGDNHVSEAGVDVKHIDGDISNDGTIKELYQVLDAWMEELKSGRT